MPCPPERVSALEDTPNLTVSLLASLQARPHEELEIDMDVLREATSILAMLTVEMVAGILGLCSNTIMPGLTGPTTGR